MTARVTTKKEEQEINKRVLRVAGALVIAGVLILGAVYLPGLLREKEEFVDEEVSRMFVGTVEGIDYEFKTFTFVLDANRGLYPDEDGDSTMPTEREVEVPIWTVTARYDDDPVTPNTEVKRVTVDLQDETSPKVFYALVPFTSIHKGDFVQLYFWQRNLSLAGETVLPFFIHIVQNPYESE